MVCIHLFETSGCVLLALGGREDNFGGEGVACEIDSGKIVGEGDK